MTQSIITAGDASAGFVQTGGNDGTLVLQTGAAGSKVNAVSFAADGTPTLLKPPVVSGGILQTLITYDAGVVSSTATTLTNVTVSNQNITPKSTTSKIIVECTFAGFISNVAASNVFAQFQLYDITNSVLIGPGVYPFGPLSSSGGTGAYGTVTLKYFVSNATLTSRSFQLRGLTTNASGAFGASQQTWTLTEVQN